MGHSPHAANLAETQPIALAGTQLTIAFPPGADFMRRRAEDDEHRATLVEALRTVTGGKLQIAYVLGEAVTVVEPTAPTEDELVQRFVAEFDAEEIHPDPDPKPGPESEAS